MFRRFFPRKDQPGDSSSQRQPDQPASPELLRKLQAAAGDKDDGVHRMAVRAGNNEPPPPEDPDEQRYAQEQGAHDVLARQALQAGDLKRAVFHLGLALASDPGNEAWLALLDQWITAAGPEALNYVPLNDPQYFMTLRMAQELMLRGNRPDHPMEVTPLVGEYYHARVAVHAYILAAQGRLSEACSLILQLLQVKRQIPYILWLARWQDRPGFAEGLDPEQVAIFASVLMGEYPGVYTFSEHGRKEIVRYLPLIQAVYIAYPDYQVGNGQFSSGFMYSTLLRKAGFFEEAIRIARAGPLSSFIAFVALAMAEKALGNLEASLAAYHQALSYKPDNVATRNDIANLLHAQGQLPEALSYMEESTRLDPNDPFQDAFATVAYLKHLLEPQNSRWRGKLQELARHQGAARHLLYLLEAPYIGKLPYAGEAVINLLRGIEAKIAAGEMKPPKTGSTFNVGLSNIESPSALLAVRRAMAALHVALEVGVDDRVPQPDIRQPLRPVEYHVWRYEGFKAVPNVPPPDPAIAEQIAQLAQIPYHLDVWHDPARRLGQRLGPAALMDLLGAMVHPPAAPQGWKEYDWIAAVQLASALSIAYIDEDWEGSRRRAALTSLAYGPMDWSGAAAIMALAVLARQDMRINIAFDRLCLDLWSFEPDLPWVLEEALVMGLIFVDSYSNEAGTKIKDYFERLRREYEEGQQ
jgi:tetratricopeptide (TPR) repeat protein